MELKSAWVEPPSHSNGRDPLGVQAPGIYLYGQLLPGITNVTDRAIYYLFYPWVVWALKEAGRRYDERFIQQFRRADALLTLIANRHTMQADDASDIHTAGLVGGLNLSRQFNKIRNGQDVRFDDFCHQEDDGTRYFKNPLGGLGQYYLGVFAEMEIMMGGSSSGIQLSEEVGELFARAFDECIDRSLFLQTLQEETVSVERLDALGGFCPCQLPTYHDACVLLADMFFVRGQFKEHDRAEQMQTRRQTLQTILCYADEHGGLVEVRDFLAATYARTLPDGSRWGVHQRHELLSIAAQGLFHLLLHHYRNSGTLQVDSDVLIQSLLEGELVQTLAESMDLDASVRSCIESTGDHWCSLNDWSNPKHEVQLALHVQDTCRAAGLSDASGLEAALRLLLILMKREETKRAYADFSLPVDFFDVYPVNLANFAAISDEWKDMSIRELLAWVWKRWNMETHFRTALRKFRYVKQSTFLLRPGDYGYEVIQVPDAVFSSPRLKQAIRILEDIGALSLGGVGVAPFGKSLMSNSNE